MNKEAGIIHVWTLLLVLLVGSSVHLAASRARLARDARVQGRAELRGHFAAEAGIEKARLLVLGGTKTGRFEIECAGIPVVVELATRQNGSVDVRSRAMLWPHGKNGLPHATLAHATIETD
ncbi:MAG: hypothetical protein KDC95_17600 [Planctomycetes bacterium]|nr:hypothetical protein [Planctomycetota bacterium]